MQDIVINDINVNIKNISVKPVNVSQIDIQSPPSWMLEDPGVLFVAPPAVVDIGVPIVNIPGCVEANKEKNPKNTNLLEDDPKGTLILCDGQTPSFNPLNFEPNRNLRTPAPKVKSQTPKKPEPPNTEVPTPKIPSATANIECPTREQQLKNPIGKIIEGNKKITGYELVGKECLMVTEQLDIVDQVISNIPNAGAVTTTASIAVVATTSALLAKPFADLLLRIVKPVTKKIIEKIASIRGKAVKVESVEERRVAQRDRNQAILTLKRSLKK
jgi:hypothetical protein